MMTKAWEEIRSGSSLLFFAAVLPFLIGFFTAWTIAAGEREKVPEMIWIEKNGEVSAYADTKKETSRIVTITDREDSGAYLAFPIYSPKDSALWNQ